MSDGGQGPRPHVIAELEKGSALPVNLLIRRRLLVLSRPGLALQFQGIHLR